MMRARRHRPRARDRPRRAPAIDRYDADSLLESESEPPTRARTRRPLARRADESHTHTHTHTHHRRATSPFASERPATRDARVDVSRPIARHPPASALVASPRIHTPVSSRFLYDHGTHIPPADYPYHPDTPPPRVAPRGTHPPITTPRASSTRPPPRALPRSPPWKIHTIHPTSAFDPPPRALARSSSTASSSRVSRARGWGKKRNVMRRRWHAANARGPERARQ